MKTKNLFIKSISVLLAVITVLLMSAPAFATFGKFELVGLIRKNNKEETTVADTVDSVKKAAEETEPEPTEEEILVDNMIKIARSKAGYYDSNINEFTNWYYGYETDAYWCSIFVCWCAAQAGAIDTAVPRRAGCDSLKKWFENKGRYYPAESGYVPQKGDIAFLNTAGDGTDSAHHVEIITEDGFVKKKGSVNKIRAIGGNTSNINYVGSEYVTEKTRPVTSERAVVIGYANPNYKLSTTFIGDCYTFMDRNNSDFIRHFLSKVISFITKLENLREETLNYFRIPYQKPVETPETAPAE